MVEIIFQGKPVAKGKVEYPPNGKNGKQKKATRAGGLYPSGLSKYFYAYLLITNF